MARRCMYENLNPSAMMMKSAKDRMQIYRPDLPKARHWRIFIQRPVRCAGRVNIRAKNQIH